MTGPGSGLHSWQPSSQKAIWESMLSDRSHLHRRKGVKSFFDRFSMKKIDITRLQHSLSPLRLRLSKQKGLPHLWNRLFSIPLSESQTSLPTTLFGYWSIRSIESIQRIVNSVDWVNQINLGLCFAESSELLRWSNQWGRSSEAANCCYCGVPNKSNSFFGSLNWSLNQRPSGVTV